MKNRYDTSLSLNPQCEHSVWRRQSGFWSGSFLLLSVVSTLISADSGRAKVEQHMTTYNNTLYTARYLMSAAVCVCACARAGVRVCVRACCLLLQDMMTPTLGLTVKNTSACENCGSCSGNKEREQLGTWNRPEYSTRPVCYCAPTVTNHLTYNIVGL